MSQFVLTNLFLLRDELVSLERTPFFSKPLESYLRELILVVDRVITEFPNFPAQIADDIARKIWTATRYLKGGTSKAVPFETVYALELALHDWTSHPCAITTALADELDYHFLGIDPTTPIRAFYPGVSFGTELIQIALPRLYRHRPLYNVALYHELGHYVDTHFKISNLSLLLDPSALSGLASDQRQVLLRHRMEHFADLFAVSYTGAAFTKFLNALAKNHPVSLTHPATVDRLAIMQDLMDGRSNPVIDAIQMALSKLGCHRLDIRYKTPDIINAFNNIRTYTIQDDGELHGILGAAWTFLESIERRDRNPWAGIPDQDAGQIINDLVEKSIRNYMTVLKWKYGNSQRQGT